MQEYIKKVPFPPTTKQFAVVIAIGAMVIGSLYMYNSSTDFEKCNKRFVNATNAVESYNKTYPEYKVALPTYSCN